MKKLTSIMLIISISLMVMSFSVPVSAEKSDVPILNYTLSETEDTYKPVTVTLDITATNKIADVRYVKIISDYPYYESDGIDDTASIPYTVNAEKIYDEGACDSNDEFVKTVGSMEAAAMVEAYYASRYHNARGENKTEDLSTPVYSKNKIYQFDIYINAKYIVSVTDGAGNQTLRMISVDNIKGSCLEPIINCTLSETEDTYKPITVTLDITDNNAIKDVRYVEVIYPYPYDIYTAIDNVVSIPSTVDAKKYYDEGDCNDNEEFAKIVGSYQGACMVNNYYSNRYDFMRGDEIEVDLSKPIYKKNNAYQFDVYINSKYIVSVTDSKGNQTLRMIEIDNIKGMSIDPVVKYTDDFSGDYYADVELNITENPYMPIKNVWVYHYIKSYAMGSSGSLNEYYKHTIEKKIKNGHTIEVKDGKYRLDNVGKYVVMEENIYGGYTCQTFTIEAKNAEPNVETEYTYGNDYATVKINVEKDDVAKIELTKRNSYYSSNLVDAFSGSSNVETINGTTFNAEYEQWYVLRVMSKDGGVAFKEIYIEKDDMPNIDIKSISVLDSSDNSITSPTVGEGFKIKADIANTSELTSGGVVLATVYDKSGAILKAEQAELNTAAGNNSYEFNIQPLDSEVSSIKVFVWDSIDTMTPLADAKSIDF